MAAVDSERFAATLTALRGLLMIAAAIVAFLFPEQAVTFLVLAGGGLLLVDGILGIATLTYSGPKTVTFWFGVVRNVLAIIAGLLVLSGSVLLTIFTMGFLAGLVGLVAILVGVMEILSTLVDRERHPKLWPSMLGGGLYILFGLALIFIPLSSAVTLVRVITVLLVLYALSLFVRAWRLRTSTP
jgi:uncharacterized membrane protein HdeD (DUF308 family)